MKLKGGCRENGLGGSGERANVIFFEKAGYEKELRKAIEAGRK